MITYFYQDENDIKDFIDFLYANDCILYDSKMNLLDRSNFVAYARKDIILYITYPNSFLEIVSSNGINRFSQQSEVISYCPGSIDSLEAISWGYLQFSSRLLEKLSNSKLASIYKKSINYIKKNYIYSFDMQSYVGKNAYERWNRREIDFNMLCKRREIFFEYSKGNLDEFFKFLNDNDYYVFKSKVEYGKDEDERTFDMDAKLGIAYKNTVLKSKKEVLACGKIATIVNPNSNCIWLIQKVKKKKQNVIWVFADARFFNETVSNREEQRKVVEIFEAIETFVQSHYHLCEDGIYRK